MRFVVSHVTKHHYDRPVFLEPHTIRLYPRSDPFQRVHDFRIDVTPAPSELAAVLDPQGNSIHHAWFKGLTELLTVSVRFDVETLLTNPFGYLLTEERYGRLPLQYAPEIEPLVTPYLIGAPAPAEVVGGFAESIAAEVQHGTIPFLSTLNQRIYETSQVEIREDGNPQPAEQTLATRIGACRDLAILFMECCRSQGLAARFVSGYQEGDNDIDRRYMHAWAEVYLPGGGWRGFDPTHGLTVADRNVAVAAGPTPETAAPISGSFRGTGAVARMEADLQMEVTEG
jgi:transglutaminase-like putative cysteine protease